MHVAHANGYDAPGMDNSNLHLVLSDKLKS